MVRKSCLRCCARFIRVLVWLLRPCIIIIIFVGIVVLLCVVVVHWNVCNDSAIIGELMNNTIQSAVMQSHIYNITTTKISDARWFGVCAHVFCGNNIVIVDSPMRDSSSDQRDYNFVLFWTRDRWHGAIVVCECQICEAKRDYLAARNDVKLRWRFK